MEEQAVRLIRENATQGKVFIHPVLRTVDIKAGEEGEKAI
jgi:nitrogen regulatory protein P-II 1